MQAEGDIARHSRDVAQVAAEVQAEIHSEIRAGGQTQA